MEPCIRYQEKANDRFLLFALYIEKESMNVRHILYGILISMTLSPPGRENCLRKRFDLVQNYV